MSDVALLAGKKIVQTDHVVAELHKSVAQMRTQKTGPAGHKHPFDAAHGTFFLAGFRWTRTAVVKYPSARSVRNTSLSARMLAMDVHSLLVTLAFIAGASLGAVAGAQDFRVDTDIRVDDKDEKPLAEPFSRTGQLEAC